MERNIPQEKAIKTINKNIAVNAGAGTGKTKVLTERFIEILENGDLEKNKEVEGIVAITFTKKASQEMVDRIREEIKNKFDENLSWSRYYRDMEKSNISTIHSFCSNILRENPIEARIDPMFEVLEDYTSAKLLKESIKEVLLRELEEKDEVYSFLRLLKRNTLDSLIEDLYSVYNLIRTVGLNFEETKKKTINYLEKLKIDQKDLDLIKNTFIYLMDNLPKSSKFYKIKDNINWIKFSEENYSEEELPGLLEFLSKNVGTSKKEAEKIQSLKVSLEKTKLNSEKENLWIYITVLDLLIEIDKLYTWKKKEIRGLDYDDLQIITSKLLDKKEIREKYQKKYKYIMVDEFQDTNELQKDIIYKLASKDSKLDRSNLFIVGDPKQSIYGFRGADINVFYKVVEDIKTESGQETITLEKNYRTVGTVLDFINNIFSKLMEEKYDKLSEFWKSDNEIDVEIIENTELEVPDNYGESEYSRYYEGEVIAKRIRQLVDSGKYKYGDFAILFRATTRNYKYEDALNKYGVPYYNTGGKRYFDQQEVKDLINALKSLVNPFDAISTIGFLRSPMIGLKDTSIYWILRQENDTIYKKMIDVLNTNNLENDESKKIQNTINLFDELYETKELYGLSKLLEKIIEDTYFIESLLLTQDGKQSLANVYKFKDMANDYEKSHSGTMEDFIDYLEEAKNRDESQGRIQSENANVVKILTIHKSKGLQFPVVIIPEMSTGSRQDHSNILFDKNIGIALKLDNGKALHDKIKEDLIKKDKEERKRVLYVAMTRAQEMLILGNQGKSQGFKEMIENKLNPKQFKLISNIDMEPREYRKINLIKDEIIDYSHKGENYNFLPYEVKDYNKRKIERYSISQYLTFKECKKKYYMDYYRNISGEINQEVDFDESTEEDEEFLISPIEKGNIVHKFCEDYREGKNKNSLIKEIFISFGMDYSEELEEEIKPYINNFLKEYDENYDKIYREKEFYLKVEDSFITGIIDRININKNKGEIIDFKTNKVRSKSKLKEQYTPQLQLYAYAVKEIMGIEIEKSRISFLESGDFIDVPVDDKSLKENLENIRDFMKFVSSNNDISDYEESERCSKNCKYKSICSL